MTQPNGHPSPVDVSTYSNGFGVTHLHGNVGFSAGIAAYQPLLSGNNCSDPIQSSIQAQAFTGESLCKVNSNLDDLPCSICGDRATGKHYGAQSCDGCKGFFRRSIRKRTRYMCRYKQNCLIDKEKRNQCRYCRLTKCYKAGMKSHAVQRERDKISSRISPFDDSDGIPISLTITLDAELRYGGVKVDMDRFHSAPPAVATKESVMDAMQMQMRQLVLWAQSLPCFSSLPIDDRKKLMKSQAAELLILGALWRSYICGQDDMLLLVNDTVITRVNQDPEVDNVANLLLDELLRPLRRLILEEKEYSALKAIVFLYPYAKDISEEGKHILEKCRHKLHVELMNYMNEKQYDSPGRFGELLLLLPRLGDASSIMLSLVNFSQALDESKVDEMVVISSDEKMSKLNHFPFPKSPNRSLSSVSLYQDRKPLAIPDMLSSNGVMACFESTLNGNSMGPSAVERLHSFSVSRGPTYVQLHPQYHQDLSSLFIPPPSSSPLSNQQHILNNHSNILHPSQLSQAHQIVSHTHMSQPNTTNLCYDINSLAYSHNPLFEQNLLSSNMIMRHSQPNPLGLSNASSISPFVSSGHLVSIDSSFNNSINYESYPNSLYPDIRYDTVSTDDVSVIPTDSVNDDSTSKCCNNKS